MSDLIEKQTVIDALKLQAEEMANWSERYAEQRKGILTAINIVSDLPSAQPTKPNALETLDCVSRLAERKRGKWINGACNQCGSHAPYWPMASTYYESNFCPNCGADMRGEKDE